ncbi:IPT/TIG domain-containing protein [Anaerophilus nitritogenes]|uniref:IPT/TIG domain-containing protein n=1 Tax=Anaerophilus nitritogenes TaxID=2498136 RepID=UPI00101B667E|nr:IPT/TIG domain-containing protein [Anaerophilus nitritogenes]
MKRIISFLLIMLMVVGIIPTYELVAWADEATVTGVLVTKTYSKPLQLDVMYIEVKGNNLEKLGANPVIVRDQMGEPIPLTTIVVSEKRLYYKIEKPKGIARMIIHGEDYFIGAEKMPQVTSLTPSNGLVRSTETLTVHGNGFKTFVDNTNGKIIFYNSTGAIDNIKPENIKETEITKEFLQNSKGGPYRLELKYTEPKDGEKAPLTIEDNYVNLFTLLGDLNISDDIEMFPNQGAPGTEVTVSGDDLIEDMSVFFLRNENDLFDIKSMGQFVQYRKDADGKKDYFVVKVPNLEQGTYHVILTNKVNPGQDPNQVIHSTKAFDNNIFIIISDVNKPTIEEIDPNKGPATGIDATIRGRYLGSMSPNIFKPTVDPTVQPNGNSLEVTYKNGTEVVGKYLGVHTDNGGVEVLELKRKLTGYVGNQLGFRDGSILSIEGYDRIEVTVPQVADEKIDPIKDVTIEIETTITYKDKDGVPKTIKLTERVTKSKGFTFEQLGYDPKIDSILPGKIPVDKTGVVYKTSLEDMKISISGQNFSVYRYIQKDAEGNDIVKYKYPVVNIGNQIILNKNEDPNVEIKVLDKNNNEIDGSEGNELGVRILVTIPKGLPSKGLNQGHIGSNTEVWVRNPLRNENPTELGTTSNPGAIQFVSVDDGKIPKITSINPNTVTTDGQKGVVITGQDFGKNVKVYMDGVEIKGAKRNEIGTEITFDAPPSKEGFAQIIVQNEEGGADVYYPFTYVKTYTNPKITNFTPKKGTAKTIVTITGDNFVYPNPLVTDLAGIGIWKVIGTRVLLGGQDVNEYYMEGKSPGLQAYTSNEPIIQIHKEELNNQERLMISENYHSIILQEGTTNPKYYIIFFDPKTGEYKLTDGDKQVYVIDINSQNQLVGKKDGQEYDLIVENNKINIDSKELIFKTPYAIKDGKIVGNKVKVINHKEIIFEVPPMPREGYYDVTVVNPDTNRDSKIGNNGFYYSFQPEYNPEIYEIDPKEGSVDGGYYINISGKGFKDNGIDQKTSVSIGSVEVDSKDVEVSPDGNNLRIKVPKYPGDLSKETDMDRKSVVVSIVNPDGGTASRINGFTYIIPISDPKITGLILNKGSAAGGDTVTIEGSGFRFFEPYKDLNNTGQWNKEPTPDPYRDLNKNGQWDDIRWWLSPEIKQAYDELAKDYQKNIVPILPKVYFGGKEVPVLRFTASTLEIETPKGAGGVIEVYVVNNDYGVSNKLSFTYESSNPKINKILPNGGRKQGKDKVEILGENFYESEIKVVTSPTTTKIEKMPLVQFGNPTDTKISNGTIPIDALENSGRIRDKESTVKIDNLTVKYNAHEDDRKLNFTIEEGIGKDKQIYQLHYDKYDDKEIFVPTYLFKNDQGEEYSGYEYIKVSLERVTGATSTYRLRVDRGFSPDSKLLKIGQISLLTPSYYTVGNVVVTLYNPDGGVATGNYTYKNPDSKPVIKNILRDGQEGYIEEDGRKIIRVNYKGGNVIDVIGSDFRKPVKISIGEAAEIIQGIEYVPDNAISQKMTFTMPAVDAKYIDTYHRVVIQNEDGGVAGSDETKPNPIYIHIIAGETDGLAITNVTPKIGPTLGGTVVTIEGKDFRSKIDGYPNETLKVYFGDGKDQVRVKDEDIIYISIDKIQLRTPAHIPGTVSIKVENPDGTMAQLSNAFTYLSAPNINDVVLTDPDNLSQEISTNIISVEGGQYLKIKGSGFMEGARVVFVPTLKNAPKDETGDFVYLKGDPKDKKIVTGTDAVEVKFIDGGTLLVKTPAGKLDTLGIIVINPDKGASNIYENIKYGLPEMEIPQEVRADIVYDQYIKVNWKEVKDAREYEIYVVVDGKKRQFVGSTELTSFVYEDLEPKTRYKFVVTAIGKFGGSKYSMESNQVKTGSSVGPKDRDGELGQKTKIERQGNIINVIIGEDDYNDHTDIDLTRGNLAGAKDVVIAIPSYVVARADVKDINIIGQDFNIKMNPKSFYSEKVRENKNKKDSGVKFMISQVQNSSIISGNTSLSKEYELKAFVYVGKENSPMNYLPSYIQITLDVDGTKADLRRVKNIYLARFDEETRQWLPIANGNTGSYAITGLSQNLGRFSVIGSRR